MSAAKQLGFRVRHDSAARHGPGLVTPNQEEKA